MAEMGDAVLCEVCGRMSPRGAKCQNCGAELESLPSSQVKFAPPRWGRLTIRVVGPRASEVLEELEAFWRELEAKTEQSLLPGQAESLRSARDPVELFGSEFSADSIQARFGGSVVVQFQQLDERELPTRR